jgi:hypothetical protein
MARALARSTMDHTALLTRRYGKATGRVPDFHHGYTSSLSPMERVAGRSASTGRLRRQRSGLVHMPLLGPSWRLP